MCFCAVNQLKAKRRRQLGTSASTLAKSCLNSARFRNSHFRTLNLNRNLSQWLLHLTIVSRPLLPRDRLSLRSIRSILQLLDNRPPISRQSPPLTSILASRRYRSSRTPRSRRFISNSAKSLERRTAQCPRRGFALNSVSVLALHRNCSRCQFAVQSLSTARMPSRNSSDATADVLNSQHNERRVQLQQLRRCLFSFAVHDFVVRGTVASLLCFVSLIFRFAPSLLYVKLVWQCFSSVRIRHFVSDSCASWQIPISQSEMAMGSAMRSLQCKWKDHENARGGGDSKTKTQQHSQLTHTSKFGKGANQSNRIKIRRSSFFGNNKDARAKVHTKGSE